MVTNGPIPIKCGENPKINLINFSPVTVVRMRYNM